MRIKNSQIFEASNLMWPQAHRCPLTRTFICTLFKFDVQVFRYTLM
jgi:hypothetical protein